LAVPAGIRPRGPLCKSSFSRRRRKDRLPVHRAGTSRRASMDAAQSGSKPAKLESHSNSSAEVVSVVHRIALATDFGTVEELGQFCGEHSEVVFCGNVTKGRSAYLASVAEMRAGGMGGPGSGSRHLVTTVVVDRVEDGHAESTATILLARGSRPAELAGIVT